jgi:hypothetical protein
MTWNATWLTASFSNRDSNRRHSFDQPTTRSMMFGLRYSPYSVGRPVTGRGPTTRPQGPARSAQSSSAAVFRRMDRVFAHFTSPILKEKV